MLTRMFAYLTLFCYLAMGTLVVRLVMPETVSLKIDQSYLQIPNTDIEMVKTADADLHSTTPMEFEKIDSIRVIPVKKKIVVAAVKKPIIKTEKRFLPFYEPVSLSPVYFNNHLNENLVSNFTAFSYEEKTVIAEALPEIKEDVISTKQAVAVQEEPTFFEYEKEPVVEQVVAEAEAPTTVKEDISEEVVTFDYTQKVEPIKEEVQNNVVNTQIAAFDYKKIAADIQNNVTPKVSSHKAPKTKPLEQEEVSSEKSGNLLESIDVFASSLKVKTKGFNLKRMENLENFEVRFQDDLADIREDFGTGEIQLENLTTQERMTRSATILKRGFAPTSTDLIIENGAGGVVVPLIEQEVLNSLNAEFEKNGPVGFLLVELDESTEVAKTDVPFGKVLTLDESLKITKSEDYKYQLFVGIQAGNALITYEKMSGDKINKIVHIHENEMTYESNFYEEIKHKRVKLLEQNLLSKEAKALVIGEDQVKSFVNQKSSQKINANTFEIAENYSNYGSRQYLELNHLSETVFVGYKDNSRIVVPSENFMRFVLSSVEGNSLVNRCVVQVNLKKNTKRFEVSSESVDDSVMIQTQVLDKDGAFYSSLSEKSEKLIIVGEISVKEGMSPDSKINVLVEYENGSSEYLSSYCSPNTYLVEQL